MGPGAALPAFLRLGGYLAHLLIYVTVWLALWAVVPALIPGWSSVVITSGSMGPGLRPGDVVAAGPVTEVLDPGAVVVFSDSGREGLVTHRVVAVNPDGTYLTRGDANPSPDSTPVAPDQVVGVARLRVPFVGLPMAWYQSGNWGALAGWLATAVLVMWLARFADRPLEARDGRQ